MHYKTRELNLFNKFLQFYWLIPNRWLLDEFTVADGKLTVTRKNGDRFDAPLTAIKATFMKDGNFPRKIVTIRYGSQKTKFITVPDMLSEDEWSSIMAVLNPTKSRFGKVLAVLKIFDNLVGD